MYRGKKAVALLLGMLLVVAAVLVAGAYVKKKYTILTVYVEGNVHYSEEEIKAIVMDGPLGDNSLYLSLKYRNKGIQNVPFVDVMDVLVLAPDTIKIIVYEKVLTGYVKYMDTLFYFDRDGCVVESSQVRTAGVPQITGLSFNHVVLGEALPVENEEVFGEILNVTKLMNKYELTPDKLYLNHSGEITAYFQEVKVMFGNDAAHLEDKIMILPKLLANLEGRKGILQMITYDENSGKYTFKPE